LADAAGHCTVTLLASVGIEESNWLQRTRPELPTMSMRGMPAPLTIY